MKEFFGAFAQRTGFFWIIMLVIAAVVGYIVYWYLNSMLWALIHAAVVILVAWLIYAIAKPQVSRYH